MKLIRKTKQTSTDQEKHPKESVPVRKTARVKANTQNGEERFWKVLIVDDEPDVHEVTLISLKKVAFFDKPIQFINVYSAEDARRFLQANSDICVALIDVVMETDAAGLDLVKFIREELNNEVIRLIIRTGQPGIAPERYVIDHYDIDDYKEKADLVADKLYTTIRSGIKAFRDMMVIENNRLGLEKILMAAPELYQIKPLELFFEGILTQIASICNLGNDSFISTINGFLAAKDDSDAIRIWAGIGKYAAKSEAETLKALLKQIEAKLSNECQTFHCDDSVVIPLKTDGQVRAYIYFENVPFVSEDNLKLVNIMAHQSEAALKNVILYQALDNAHAMNEKKNQFLGMAAHDLINPIGFIDGFSRSFLKKTAHKLSESEIEMIHAIQSASITALSIINDLLDIAKIESKELYLEKEETDLCMIILQAIRLNQLHANSKKIEIENQCGEALPLVNADPNKLIQVISNLLSNAIKYSNHGTSVTIKAGLRGREQVCVSVTDEGLGISEENISTIFQPFAETCNQPTSGETSTGLGLVICKKIVEAHNGQIWVESAVGQGSTFSFAIPLT